MMAGHEYPGTQSQILTNRTNRSGTLTERAVQRVEGEGPVASMAVSRNFALSSYDDDHHDAHI